jgi:diguanylate cyclase (GGDEF)-like protein
VGASGAVRIVPFLRFTTRTRHHHTRMGSQGAMRTVTMLAQCAEKSAPNREVASKGGRMWRWHGTIPDPEACRHSKDVQRELLALMFATTPVVLAANLINGTLIAGVFVRAHPPQLLAIWWALLFVMVLARGAVWLRYRHHTVSNRWLATIAIAGSGTSGVLWGVAGLLFYPQANEAHLMVLAFILGGMGAGAVSSLTPFLPAFYVYLFPSVVPFCTRLALEGDPDHLVMATACLMYMFGLTILGQRANRWLTESVQRRFENADLIRSLERRVEGRTATLAEVNEQLRRDIARRRTAESALAEYGERQAALADFSRIALSEFDLDALFGMAVSLVRDRLSATSAAVLEHAGDPPKSLLRAACGSPPNLPPLPHPAVHDLADHPQIGLDSTMADRPIDASPVPLRPSCGATISAEVVIAGHGSPFGALLAAAIAPRQFSDNDISFLQSIANVLAAAIERKRAEQEIQLLALQDPLTGLPNRVLFRNHLHQELIQTRRSHQICALLIIDLDHFKDINDTLGHPTGDRLLAAVAARLKASLRESDAPARLGGDEFAVILSDLRSPDDAASIAQKLVSHLCAPFFLDGHELYIGASVGITISPRDAADVDGLLRTADLALYRAKTEGRNTYKFYAADMAERIEARKGIEHDLRHALERDEFFLEYQPQFDLATGRLVGAEALIRWRHPHRGLLMPDTFISIAEATGLILPMGRWVLERVGMQVREWKEAGLPPVFIAANVSLNQCLRGDLVSVVKEVAAHTACALDWLEIEVTEQFFMPSEIGDAITMLRQLSELGVTISIDDFGTGYSSLGRLRSLPVDKVKIDKSFIEELGKSRDAEMLVCAVITLGRSLGVKVTAEGVENHEQLAFLTAQGCDYAQGYHLSIPLSQHKLAMLIRDNHASANGAEPTMRERGSVAASPAASTRHRNRPR